MKISFDNLEIDPTAQGYHRATVANLVTESLAGDLYPQPTGNIHPLVLSQEEVRGVVENILCIVENK